MPRLLYYWSPAALWAAVILIASGHSFSAPHSGSWLEAIVAALRGRPLPPDTAAIANLIIRKLTHLVSYAILGALLFRAVRGDARGWMRKWAALAIGIAAAVAIVDESRQALVPSRSGSLADVAMDCAGAALATAALKSRSR